MIRVSVLNFNITFFGALRSKNWFIIIWIKDKVSQNHGTEKPGGWLDALRDVQDGFLCLIWLNWPFNPHEEFEYEHQPLCSFVMVDFPKLITDRHLLTPVKSWIFESLSFSFFKPSCSSTFLKRFCCHLPERSNKHISALSVWTPEGFGAPVSVDTN